MGEKQEDDLQAKEKPGTKILSYFSDSVYLKTADIVIKPSGLLRNMELKKQAAAKVSTTYILLRKI